MTAASSVTTVVNIRRVKDADSDPDLVYVGRPMPRHRFACVRRGSPLGNPFKDGRPDVLDRYRAHVLSRPDLVALLPSLRGKKLACWCCDDDRPADTPDVYHVCHAQALAALIEEVVVIAAATPAPSAP